ncbi:MAG: hypothetical protein JWQ49_3377 [Edaphobacter sp.]|nr:hypothetical protein [Edaphobacter sp.]
MPGEISSKAVRRGQPRTFADDDQAKARTETKADRIPNCHPALLHQANWSDRPPGTEKLREKLCKQRNGMVLNRKRGEAIGDDDGEVAAGDRLKLHYRIGVERPAKHRLAEISTAIGGVAQKLKNRNTGFSKLGEFRAEALRKGRKVQSSMDRVARLSVRKLEIKHFTRGDAMACSRQGHPRGRKVAEIETASWDER